MYVINSLVLEVVNMEDTIVNEKNKYNKAYTELMFCVDDLRKMLDTEELEKRSFISKVDTLKDYIEFLDNLEKESKKDKGLFKKLFKIENDSNQKISKYLTLDKRRDLEKIDKCSKCECRNCVSICNMNHCFNCREKNKNCTKRSEPRCASNVSNTNPKDSCINFIWRFGYINN